MEITLQKHQMEMLQDESRFLSLRWGRRSGKTFTLALWLLTRACEFPNTMHIYGSNGFSMSTDFLKRELLPMCEGLPAPWLKGVNFTELSVTLCNNSVIRCVSLLDAGDRSIRGRSIKSMVVDECQDIENHSVFSYAILPALADVKGSCRFAGTTKASAGFFKAMCEKYPSRVVTTSEAKLVDAEEIDLMRANMSSDAFRQELECEWISDGDSAYNSFDFDYNVLQEVPEIVPGATIHVAADFGARYNAWSILQLHGGIATVIHEISQSDTHTDMMCKELEQWLAANNIDKSLVSFTCDPAGKQRRSSAKASTDYSIITEDYGFHIDPLKSAPRVVDRVAAVNRALRDSNGITTLLLSPKCKVLLKDFLGVKWADTAHTKLCKKDDQKTHISDGLGYFVYRHMLPTKKRKAATMRPLIID